MRPNYAFVPESVPADDDGFPGSSQRREGPSERGSPVAAQAAPPPPHRVERGSSGVDVADMRRPRHSGKPAWFTPPQSSTRADREPLGRRTSLVVGGGAEPNTGRRDGSATRSKPHSVMISSTFVVRTCAIIGPEPNQGGMDCHAGRPGTPVGRRRLTAPGSSRMPTV